MLKEGIIYPIRINRYLFLKGYCSRRAADRFIEEGHVFFNGKSAKLGDKVEKGDTVTVDHIVESARHNYLYYAYNKPRGIVSHNPQRNERGIEDVFAPAKKSRLSPLGRLDKESHGLMLLSNDGRIVNSLLNPKNKHEKEYIVTVDKTIPERVLRTMAKGVKIERYTTRSAQLKKVGERKFNIILTEGKKHQIRRMCAALGYQVKDLRRVRILHIRLGSLKENQGRKLKGREVGYLLEILDLKTA